MEKSVADEVAVEHILAGFKDVTPRDDMAAAFRSLHRAGIRVCSADRALYVIQPIDMQALESITLYPFKC